MIRYVYNGPVENQQPELELQMSDLLWLGRAFMGEHGGINYQYVPAFTWTMINRFILHPGNKSWPSFQYMLRHFSQPINPRWARGGDLALKNPKQATEKHLERREFFTNLTWDQIPRAIQVILGAFVTGFPGTPQEIVELEKRRISNFAAVSPRMKKKYPHGVNIGGNWYFEDKRLRTGVVAIDIWSKA